MSEIYVVAINPVGRIAILSTDEVVSINRFFCDGEEVDDPVEAQSAVAQLPNGEWIVIDFGDFGDFVTVTRH